MSTLQIVLTSSVVASVVSGLVKAAEMIYARRSQRQDKVLSDRDLAFREAYNFAQLILIECENAQHSADPRAMDWEPIPTDDLISQSPARIMVDVGRHDAGARDLVMTAIRKRELLHDECNNEGYMGLGASNPAVTAALEAANILADRTLQPNLKRAARPALPPPE